ncbi:MAG TPA: PKD domain-containing protein [Phycisphaerae bacterium]|nr:PKD domain-containing protein [Phycisphaerae bacterium]
MNLGTRKLLPTALAVLLAASPAFGAAGWWNVAWAHRRAIDVESYQPTKLPGDDVGVVTMPTAGLTRADGADVRVTTSAGKPLPTRVLSTGPGDRAVVAFALEPGTTRYYAYFGCADPPPQAKPLDIRRGVLQQTWANPGGGTGNLEQARAVFERAKTLLGADFRDRIFQAHNPFGPQTNLATIYTAWLNCPADGKYLFCLSSQNASFLLVDDALLLDNGGFHAPQDNISKRTAADLKAGLHKLTVYHVSSWGDPTMVVAWRPPETWRVEPVPPGAFAPVFRGRCGPIEDYGRGGSIDFVPDHAGEAFMDNAYFQRYAFEALTAGRLGQNVSWRWDFGDGQTSEKASVEHVYLADGLYTVTLTARTALGELKRTNRISVTRDWDAVIRNEVDGLGKHARIVAGYDFRTLDAESAGPAMALLKRAGSAAAVLRAGEGFLRRDSAPATAVQQVVPAYADALAAAGQATEAVIALIRGSKMTDHAGVTAELLVQAGQITLDRLGKIDDAEKLFATVLQKYALVSSSPAIRLARIGLGDVRRARGERDKAMEAYLAAGASLPPNARGGEPVVRGDFVRHVEAYLRDRKLRDAEDYLDRWEQALPADKLDGFSTLYRVRLRMDQKQYAPAAREAETLVRVSPASNYAPELLLMAAECYEKLNDAPAAKAALKRVVEKYPESSLAATARKKLAEK